MFRYHALTFGLLAALGLPTAHAQDDPQQLLIRQGHFWQAQEKPERAAEAWNRLLELDAAQVDALYGLGAIALDKGNTAQARKYLARLQAVEPLPRQALQLEQDIHLSSSVNSKELEEARLLVDNGERAQASQHYRQLLGKREPQGLIAREFYNNLGFLDEHWTEARAGLERLVRERPDDSIAALFLAQQLARRESTRPEGIRALAKLTAREDIQGYAEEGWRLALTWIAEPKPADAPLFEHYLKTHPDDEEIHALLAKARNAPAKPAAWKPDPDVARGLAALDRKDLAGAEKAFAKRLKASPNDPDALGGLGVVRQQQDKLEDAEFLLTKAVRQPRGGSWKKALGEVRYWRLLDSSRQATGNAALALVQQAIALQPNNTEGLRQRANIHLADGNFVQAEADYRQVLQRKPADADAQRGLIDTMVQAGRTEEALTLIDQLPTESRDALGNLGELRANQAMQRARIAEAKGDQAGARQALEQALQHDPNNAWARFALARIYLQLGAVPEARSLIDGLLTSNPDDPQALYVSALLSAELGEWQKADEALRRIPVSARTADIQQLASDTTFQLQLQQISQLSAAGRKQDARVFLARTVPLAEGRPERQSALAQAYASQVGNVDFAATLHWTLGEWTYAVDTHPVRGDGEHGRIWIFTDVTADLLMAAELRRLASSDPLTGVPNRRHFEESSAQIIAAKEAGGRCVAVLMLDVDHFKKINDTHGHPVGDEVLKVVARRCRDALREHDLFARFGGEEFIALLPSTSAEEAPLAAERLRSVIAAEPVHVDGLQVPVTISVGGAVGETLPGADKALLELLVGQADEALYAAKANGRNRVMMGGPAA